MDLISVDLWAANLEIAGQNLEEWLARVEARLSDASARQVDLLILPEFCCAQWLSFAPVDLPESQQLEWLSGIAPIALDRLKDLSKAYNVAILPGTMPCLDDSSAASAGYRNRAWFLTPEGNRYFQDKLSLTPLEAHGAAGTTIAGQHIQIMHWRGMRFAIAVCLDAEYTALWERLGKLNLDLVIIPAKTDMITGFNRVFGCARSRAIELQTVICAVGAVGAPLTHPSTDTGTGGAAVFLPCDVSISLDGHFAMLPPRGALETYDPILHVPGIPIGLCRSIRNGSAEAEKQPARWSASHLHVTESVA